MIVAGIQLPIMPLTDVVGRIGSAEFWQSGPMPSNMGVTWLVISTSIVAVVPHWPAAGVNVYLVVPMMVVLIVSGLHEPTKPSTDVFGNDGGFEFWHRRPIGSKVGTIWDVISISNVAVEPHCPPVGVKVYVDLPMVDVLMVAGLQVPVKPSTDVVGKAGATELWQKGPIGSNVTASSGRIVILIFFSSAHCPLSGVKVYSVVPAIAVLMVDGLHVPVMPPSPLAGSAGGVLN